MKSICTIKARDCRGRILPTLVMAMAGIAAASSAAMADILIEEHHFTFEQATPTFDTTYTMPFELPKFDTMGGTRELLALRVSASDAQTNYSYTTPENPDTEYHSCMKKWRLAWSAHGESGSPSFPMFFEPPYQWAMTRGRGVARPPVCPATGPYHITYTTEEPAYGTESMYDPAYLANLTGTGSIPMVAEFEIGAVQAVPWTPPGWPEGQTLIFDPDILNVTLDLMHAGLWVDYYYSPVPEPGSLALLSLGALVALRRRR